MVHPDRQIEHALSSGLIRRARHGLGGSHTVVTYPPLAALNPISDTGAIEAALRPSANLNLYFHLPYCEHVCAFCHYAKSYSPIGSSSEDMRVYLGALEAEIERRRGSVNRSIVDSIYIGGGTPTVLSTRDLGRLLDTIGQLVPGRRGKFCIEVSPQTVAGPEGLEKLALIRDAGVDRISIGVQTFSDRLLRRHRGHGQADVLSACDRVLGTGAQVNIDLLQDLPGQSWRDLTMDCRTVERLAPDQVTWYVLRSERGSSWYKQIRDGRLEDLPTDAESATRRLCIFDIMETAGYRIESGGRFMRGIARDHYKHVRSGIEQALLGFGLSSYSHGWGWFFRNVHLQSSRAGARAYVARQVRGESPIETGMPISPAEQAAAGRLRALRTLLPHGQLTTAGDEGLRLIRLLRALEAEGLVACEPTGWTLSHLGRAFEEEILSLFYSPAVRRSLAARGAYWAADALPLAALLGLSDPLAPQEAEYATV